jgi:uncharacterized RDD family membrane protein YckC
MNGSPDTVGGYRSEASKRTFTIVAGVLGALFFVVQFVAPMAVMLLAMPAALPQFAFTRYAVEGSALFRGRIHVVRSTIAGTDPKQGAAPAQLVRIDGDSAHELASLPGWLPSLLADDRQLWLISSARVGVFDGTAVRAFDVAEPLGDISRPFLLRGAPAVIESRPEGRRLMTWRQERWQLAQPLTDVDCRCQVQAVSTDAALVLVRQEGDTLYARDLGREGGEWDVVTSRPSSWFVFVKDGRPAVASSSSEEGFRLVEYDGARWRRAGDASMTTAFPEAVAAFQDRPGGPVTVLQQSFPAALKLRTWDGSRLIDERRVGRSSLFPPAMILMMVFPQVAAALSSLVLAVILSSLMRVHRIGVYAHAGVEVTHASLTRRALSQVVDAIVTIGPASVVFWRMFDFEGIFEAGPAAPLRFFALMAGALAWMLLVLVAFSVGEGLWGLTPGKWLVGIRVVGTDLAPCGFGRALVRNLLKLIDGFFNYLVGILMVAYTPDWQRLGDMAARTIVVRGRPRPASHR